jgi:hypothetical protein
MPLVSTGFGAGAKGFECERALPQPMYPGWLRRAWGTFDALERYQINSLKHLFQKRKSLFS